MSSSILAVADRVDRRARLVHEDDVGLGGDAARDAEPLLLPAREGDAGLAELVLDLVPERRPLRGVLDAVGELRPVELVVLAQPVGDVVEDRHREGARLLEDHADSAPQLEQVGARSQDVAARRA